MTSRVGAKGQVVIPRELRDRDGPHPGAQVEFELRDDAQPATRGCRDSSTPVTAADEVLAELRAHSNPISRGRAARSTRPGCFAVVTAAAHGLVLPTGDPEILEQPELPCPTEDLRE